MRKRALPLGTNILVNPIANERKTDGGIILLDEKKGNPYRKGVVEEKSKDGDKWNDMSEIRKGDVILFSQSAGVPVVLENDKGEPHAFLLVPYEKSVGVE